MAADDRLRDEYGQPDLSIVEEMDPPEPAAKEGWFNPGREALLGILLLVGIVLWAGWQWLDGEHKASSYQAAQQAAASKDWDKASEQFRNASGYKDADKRGADAANLVIARNNHYNIAVHHLLMKEGVAALVELGAVEEIQPHYSDTLRLEERAKSDAYDEALIGVIASRPDAQPPGLYYRLNGKWVWLEGSDAQSQIRSNSDSVKGRVAYDAPDVVGLDTPIGEGRRIMLAILPTEGSPSAPSVKQLIFKLDEYDTFNCQGDGVWAFKCCGPDNPPPIPISFPLNYYQSIAFQGNDQSMVLPMRLPGTDENRAILDIDYTRHQLLSANWDYEVGAGSGASPIVNVFLASTSPSFISMGMGMQPGGPGTNLRLLYTQHGKLVKAQFSSDGNFALLTTVSFASQEDLLNDVGNVALLAVDLKSASPTRVLAQENRIAKVSEIGTFILSGFRSAVISRGPYSGHVVVAHQEEGAGGSKNNVFELIDPTDHANPPVQIALPGEFFFGTAMWSGTQSDAGLLLTAQPLDSQSSPGAPLSTTVAIFDFAGGREHLISAVKGDPDVLASPVGLRGDNLLYSFNYVGSTSRNKLETYRIPVTTLRSPQDILKSAPPLQVEPQLVYSGPYLRVDNSSRPNGPFMYTFNYGPGAMAYSDGKDLYVGTYDGAGTVKLESGVIDLYAGTSQEDDRIFLR